MTHPGFLRAICEDPDDDAHRLVYADWLDEHGDADRAEFIRLQCALAATDDEDEAMKAREAELLRLHGEAWRAELPHLPKVTWNRGFRRGFVESAALPNYTAWRNQGLALLAAAPVETVAIAQVTPNTVRRLARSPGVDRVRGLMFPTGNFGDDELEALGKACRLRTFYYSGSPLAFNVGPSAGRILGTAPGFRGLRHLTLGSVSVGDTQAAALASWPNLAELESLVLSHCNLSPAGIKLLLNRPVWTALRTLNLAGNAVGDIGARLLASSPGTARLRELYLYQSNVGDAGATAIARSMFLTGLSTLQLSSCPIGSAGVRALSSSLEL